MQIADKFYRDAVKTIKRSQNEDSAIDALRRLFAGYTKGFGELAGDLFEYWALSYGLEPLKNAALLADMLDILNDSYEPRANGEGGSGPALSGGDWRRICEIVSDNAQTADMNVVSSIMRLALSRGAVL